MAPAPGGTETPPLPTEQLLYPRSRVLQEVSSLSLWLLNTTRPLSVFEFSVCEGQGEPNHLLLDSQLLFLLFSEEPSLSRVPPSPPDQSESRTGDKHNVVGTNEVFARV